MESWEAKLSEPRSGSWRYFSTVWRDFQAQLQAFDLKTFEVPGLKEEVVKGSQQKEEKKKVKRKVEVASPYLFLFHPLARAPVLSAYLPVISRTFLYSSSQA